MSHPAHEPRYMCSQLVNVLYEDRSLILNQTVANLEELSSTHATLLLEERLAPGSPASFHAKGHDLNGFVESSEYYETLGWMVEIELEPASKWNAEMFIPDHSLRIFEPLYAQAIEAA
jgi:hypothetical protein